MIKKMERKRAQIAMEYLILTAFILVAVAIIFAFSFLNYSQNLNIAKANETLSKMENAVNDVYTRGEGNTRFVSLSLPDGMQNIGIIHKCGFPLPEQGTLAECKNSTGGSPAEYSDLNFSAIAMEVKLLGGTTTVMRETKAVILEGIGDIALGTYAGSSYTIKVSWTETGEQIKLEKV